MVMVNRYLFFLSLFYRIEGHFAKIVLIQQENVDRVHNYAYSSR